MFRYGVFICFGLAVSISLFLWIYWDNLLETYFLSEHYLKKEPVINRHLYGLILTPTVKECVPAKRLHILIIVTSYVGHIELRSAHRRSMPKEYLDQFNATRVFLLAQVPSSEKYITQTAVKNEYDRFGDIIQGSFVENYRNLTYKHLMGLNWAATNCNNTDYILKIDDDTVFNLDKINEVINKHDKADKDNFLLGYILNARKPIRREKNKWFVSPQEYAEDDYPAYLSGWLYVTTPAVATKLVTESAYFSYFWIDDVFVTGILRKAVGIKLMDFNTENIWLVYYEQVECCLRDTIEKHISCEYAVGPNGGRNNLILEFNKVIKDCKNCTKRTKFNSLNRTCYVNKDRSIFSSGEAQIINL